MSNPTTDPSTPLASALAALAVRCDDAAGRGARLTQVYVHDLRAVLAEVERLSAALAAKGAAPTVSNDMDYDDDLATETVNSSGALIASPWYEPEKGSRIRSYYDDLCACVDDLGWVVYSCMGRGSKTERGPETGKDGEAKVDEWLRTWSIDIDRADVWWFKRCTNCAEIPDKEVL